MESRNLFRLAVPVLALSMLAGLSRAGEVQKPLGVVELFTSQGCSSCPAADAFFAELASKGEVIALAYHVNYWDYLGWKDTLGTAENTERQYDYMRAFGARSVYTPQAVINGRAHVSGADRAAVQRQLGQMSGAGHGMVVGIKVSRDGSTIKIEAGPANGAKTEAHVKLVYFDPPQPVEIERGENKGKTVTYWNAVTGAYSAGMWHGEAARYELPASEIAKKGEGGCAVLLQAVGKDGSPGAILGAALIGKPAAPQQ
jgi:hypothetical protein